MTAAVELREVRKGYGGAAVLRGLSLEVAPGEILVLLGRSGCGKTTTLRILAGLDEPDAGTVLMAGREVSNPGIVVPAWRRGVAMVFQSLALWPHMTVEQNLLFVARDSGGRRARTERARAILSRFGLEDRRGAYPGDLSQGEAQRVALARALLQDPSVLLLDEPFSNTDVALRATLLDDLRRLQRERGITTLYVTHQQEEAMLLADRVGVLQGGALEQVASPTDLYRCPATPFVASFVGVNNLLQGRARDGQVITPVGAVGAADGRACVTVAIRPDALALRDDAEARGRVRSSAFAGRHWLVTVDLDGGASVQVEHREAVAAEQPVGVALRGEAWVVPQGLSAPGAAYE